VTNVWALPEGRRCFSNISRFSSDTIGYSRRIAANLRASKIPGNTPAASGTSALTMTTAPRSLKLGRGRRANAHPAIASINALIKSVIDVNRKVQIKKTNGDRGVRRLSFIAADTKTADMIAEPTTENQNIPLSNPT
jgi:hypothetical protein